MESKTMSVPEAVNAIINMLEKVEVKGYNNTSNVVHSQELLAKIAKFYEEEAKKQEDTVVIEPVEINPEETVEE